jgi:hypothetical protein
MLVLVVADPVGMSSRSSVHRSNGTNRDRGNNPARCIYPLLFDSFTPGP